MSRIADFQVSGSVADSPAYDVNCDCEVPQAEMSVFVGSDGGSTQLAMGAELICGRLLFAGRWNDVRHYIKLNDPGKHNGVFELFLNGQRVMSADNVLFRKTGMLNRQDIFIHLFFVSDAAFVFNFDMEGLSTRALTHAHPRAQATCLCPDSCSALSLAATAAGTLPTRTSAATSRTLPSTAVRSGGIAPVCLIFTQKLCNPIV
jgi:hypothetical protein